MWTKEQIDKELTQIQNSVPSKWRAQLFKTVKKTPVAEMVIKKALKNEEFTQEKREELKTLLRTGEFSKTETVLDEDMSKKIDKHVERKINYAIKLGKLPTREELEKLPFYKEQYGNKKES